MSLNYKEIDLILAELNLAGARIDKINQPDRFSLFLELYGKDGKLNLIISLNHGVVRLNRIESKPKFPDYPPRFAQLLRARIKGGRIISAEQPGGERIIKFTIKSHNCTTNLWIRLWSGNPNIILTDENNIIIDTFFRKPAASEIQGELFNPDLEEVEKKGKQVRKIREFPSHISFNQFINNYYSNKNIKEDFSRLKEKELKRITMKINKRQFHLTKLQKREKKFSHPELYRQQGELILSSLYKLKKGDRFLITENFFKNNEIIKIPLKEDKSPNENSEIYFKKYKKSLQGIKIVKEEILMATRLIDELTVIMRKISESDNPEGLNSLIEKKEINKTHEKHIRIGLLFHSGKFRIQVGRNSKENDQILRKDARGNDMWLHVRGYPGGFVIIKTIKGKTIPLETLLDAANLALLYSSKKYKDKAEIYYTEVKHLRRVKGGKEGLVIPHNEKTLSIIYDENRIKRVQQKKNLLERSGLIKDN